MRTRIRTLVTVTALAACSKSNAPVAPPPNVRADSSVTGSWRYTITNLTWAPPESASHLICADTALMQLVQIDTSIAGSFGMSRMPCSVSGSRASYNFLLRDTGAVRGTLYGSVVAFRLVNDPGLGFGGGPLFDSGTVTATSIAGTVSGMLTVYGDTSRGAGRAAVVGPATGTFTAVRQ